MQAVLTVVPHARIFALFALCGLSLGCHFGTESTADDGRRIDANPRIILDSEFPESRSQTFRVGHFKVANARAAPARMIVESKSCGCIEISGVADVLSANDESFVDMTVNLAPTSRSQTYSANVMLEWPDGERRRFFLHQAVQVLAAIELRPGAFSIQAESRGSDNRSLTVVHRYRSDASRQRFTPVFRDPPDWIVANDFDQIGQNELPDGVVEVIWKADVVIQPERISNLREKMKWLRIEIIEEQGKYVASKEFPVAVIRDRGVSAHPSEVFINGAHTKRIALRSWDGRPFRVEGVQVEEEASRAFRVLFEPTVEKAVHTLDVQPTGVTQSPGAVSVTVATSHPDTPKISFSVVVSPQ